MMGSGTVQNAAVLKDTTDLLKKVVERDALETQLKELKEEERSSKEGQLKADLEQVKKDIVEERRKVEAAARQEVDADDGSADKVPDPVNLSKAFVTFKQARSA